MAVDDPELIEQIAEETRFIRLAPVAIFVTYSHRYTRENLAWVQSASAAVQNMMLMAHDLGLGGCWVDTLGDVNRIKRLLRLSGRANGTRTRSLRLLRRQTPSAAATGD